MLGLAEDAPLWTDCRSRRALLSRQAVVLAPSVFAYRVIDALGL